MLFRLFVVILVGLISVPASADIKPMEPVQPIGRVPVEEDVQHQFSLTISPFSLLLPFAELTAELRLADKFGVAAIAGVGTFKDETVSAFLLGGGLSGRYYPIGSFIHGMQTGLEVQYLYADATSTQSSNVTAVAGGLSISPFLGYKIATNVGFTFEIQGGVSYFLVRADARNNATAETETASGSDVGVLLNLNLGWSF